MTIRRRLKKAPRRQGPYRASPASRALFQNVIEAMSDGMMIIDRQGHISVVNQALGRMLGLEPQAMLGRGWAELFFDGRGENDAFNDVVLEGVQQQACHQNCQVTYHPPQGPPRELIVTTDLLLDQTSQDRVVMGMLAVFKDVTEIKALHRREQELMQKSQRLYQEKLEGLGRLALAVAHEIRNPVMSIGGLSLRLLGQCGPEGRQSQYLERIISSSRRLEHIVAQVSDYADLPTPRPAPLELLPWLMGLAGHYRGRAQEQGVRLVGPQATAGLEGLKAPADPKLLGRLMAALLENALEAMPQGGELRLDLTRRAGPGRAVISVSDTGRGVDPGDLPYIFDPFFTTKAAGVGMGLAMAKRIAEDHDAVLAVDSAPGQGATFSLSLPLE
ncbi:MAG: PAS domain-containing protein [Desulfarculus sp.]|nr:PAS domain-containing protein [Desulfarculus sp.]